ncbi:MAG: hypothetical protein FWH14_06460 [Oscillospiraceae bacterium]|nr:hypothetical protein [Oscillospiraceae bacterium]
MGLEHTLSSFMENYGKDTVISGGNVTIETKGVIMPLGQNSIPKDGEMTKLGITKNDYFSYIGRKIDGVKVHKDYTLTAGGVSYVVNVFDTIAISSSIEYTWGIIKRTEV